MEYNEDFVKRILPKMDYQVLYDTAKSVSDIRESFFVWLIRFWKVGVELPPQKDEQENSEFLNQLHHALLEVEVVTGELVCPETGRKFPIKNGIPNMLCNEEEV